VDPADAVPAALGYDQRLWLLEDREILVVDDYGIEEFDAVLADARWSEAEEEDTQTVEYRGMTLELPAEWEVARQEHRYVDRDGAFATGVPEEIVDESILISTDPDNPCTFEDRLDCPHVEIAGPGAITTERVTGDALYYTGGGAELCTTSYGAAATPPREEQTLAPIGERMAYYRVWSMPCMTSIEPNTPLNYYEQRYWLLPESQILVVDNFRTEGLAEILADADLPE
jgi:hypothetical protein